jgi:predicted ATP-grasp superfamily ATP-dependent carboligase
MLTVTITDDKGRVIDTIKVNTDSYKLCAVYPDDMASQSIVEVLNENFNTDITTEPNTRKE